MLQPAQEEVRLRQTRSLVREKERRRAAAVAPVVESSEVWAPALQRQREEVDLERFRLLPCEAAPVPVPVPASASVSAKAKAQVGRVESGEPAVKAVATSGTGLDGRVPARVASQRAR